MLITILMFWLQRALLGRRGYTTVSGKGGERRITRLGPWRWVLTASGVNETWIEAFSYTRDLVSGEGLIQQIDVKPSDDLRLIGWIRRQTGAMSYKVWLNLTHVSVTPGQCRAH